MGRASRANPLSRDAAAGRLIRPVVMPRTKQRVHPAHMSPAGLEAWTKARLTRDVVLDTALIETMVSKAARGKRGAVRRYLEGLRAEQQRDQAAKDHAITDTFIARNVRYRGGLSLEEPLPRVSIDDPLSPRVSLSEMVKAMEAAPRPADTEGARLTPESPTTEDRAH